MSLSIRNLFILSALTFGLAGPLAAADREWFQVRIYHLKSEAAESLFDKTMEEAVVPGFKKLGITQVGIFKPVAVAKDREANREMPRQRVMILALESPDVLASMPERLASDDAFVQAAGPYLSVSKENAIYDRVESSLLYAFEGMPKLVIPEKETEGPRLFELRVYESYSEMKGKRKVEMFNNGEIEIFNEVGLQCLFFGEAVVGKNLPQLTYLSVYNDEEHRGKVWSAFLKHPKWDALKKNERYKDTVSKIISQHMQALPYSPIQ